MQVRMSGERTDLAVEAKAIAEDRAAFNFNMRVLREAFRLRNEDTVWTIKHRIEENLSAVLAKGGRWALEYALRAMELNGLLIHNQNRALRSPGAPTPATVVRLHIKLGSYSRPGKTPGKSPGKPDSESKKSEN